MSSRYSSILVTIFVTLMYGYAIPMLFPISACTFLFYYIADKLSVTYHYQKPPMYDDNLHEAALNLMKYAPLFSMFFGYWCMGNVQIFGTFIIELSYSNIPITTGHHITPTVGPELPLLIVGLFIVLVIMFPNCFTRVLRTCRIMD